MTKDEALKLALKALEMFCEHGAILRPIETRDAIKKALANEALEKMAENARELGLDYEPAQEPVAWTLDSLEQEIYEKTRQFVSLDVMELLLNLLNTSPPQRTWVGLTPDELNAIFDGMKTWSSFQITDVYFAIEAKLKEKNT